MNILVTGAAGYIGSVCTEVLLGRGHKVLALDNLSEGHRQAIPNDAFFVSCDLADREALYQTFRSYPIDAVMHFAAASIVERSVREPCTFYVSNVANGIHLLDAMVSHGVKKIIFSSTAAVYGNPTQTTTCEEDEAAPINPYGRSKLMFESLLHALGAESGLQFIILRYFNAAGASQERGEDHHPETHLIPILLETALGRRDRFRVNGNNYDTPDGTCVRDFVHVLDIAEAHILALDQLDRFPAHVFNVGNSRGYSVLEVLEAVRRITGLAIPTTVGPRRPGDPPTLVAGADKIRRDLGWKPQLSDLDTIIRSAWVWKKKSLSGYTDGAETPPRTAGSTLQSPPECED